MRTVDDRNGEADGPRREEKMTKRDDTHTRQVCVYRIRLLIKRPIHRRERIPKRNSIFFLPIFNEVVRVASKIRDWSNEGVTKGTQDIHPQFHMAFLSLRFLLPFLKTKQWWW